jgi:hypothetical protein
MLVELRAIELYLAPAARAVLHPVVLIETACGNSQPTILFGFDVQ